MSGWLLVAGDFTTRGGMDSANHALARFLAEGGPVHLVTHQASDELADHPNVTLHRVPRPFGRHLLGQPLLRRTGERWARRLSRQGFRVVVNGGNCRWPDINWVHCVHSAYAAPTSGGYARRAKIRLDHVANRRAERLAVRAARVVVCNSRRTAADLVSLVGVDPDRIRVVYLGSDPTPWPAVTRAERDAIRADLGWEQRPWVGFIGQLGNRIKGFDILYSAWRELCRNPEWDANLAVIGSGADLPRWQSHTTTDGLENRVRFLGYRADVPRVLAACDVLAHPARYDAYGLVVQEAICRGLPVVVSSAAGVSERYPAPLQELLLRTPADSAELVDRLWAWRRAMAAWPGRFAELAATLQGYTWNDMAVDFVRAVT